MLVRRRCGSKPQTAGSIEQRQRLPKLLVRSNRVRRARVPPMREIAPGLWRWTAPHPAWRPGAEPDSPDDWDESVGSALYIGRDTAVFIDPLVPPDEEQFWSWADERVSERNVAVLTTLLPHRRSREQVAHRYRASTSRVRRNLPDGVESIVLRGARETMFWLPEHRDAGPRRPHPRSSGRRSDAVSGVVVVLGARQPRPAPNTARAVARPTDRASTRLARGPGAQRWRGSNAQVLVELRTASSVSRIDQTGSDARS